MLASVWHEHSNVNTSSLMSARFSPMGIQAHPLFLKFEFASCICLIEVLSVVILFIALHLFMQSLGGVSVGVSVLLVILEAGLV